MRRTIAVLCRDDHDRPPGLEELTDRADVIYATADTLPEAIETADALFVWDFFSPAVRIAWPRARRLEWIHVASAGVDALLFDDLVGSEVLVSNARGVFDQPIAEYVLAAILAQAKQLYRSRDLQQAHRWQHRETRSIAGMPVLVIGTGGIGRAIARLLRAAGMQVTGAGRRTATDDPDFGTVVDSARLVDHVGTVDHLVMAAPLTAQTTGMINADVLAAMRPGAHLINVGRGPSVDEDAVLQSLRSGHLGAASLDVFVDEPLADDHPFWDEPGMHISPHLSGDTEGWLDRLATQFVEQADRWLDGRELINIVDKQRGYAAPTGRGQQ
ncbi:D-2-hydroxyacid dehydrogenase [Microlunatus soli]|uniref:Phosphoglycerate dehydrogenase n=1 Tax=Microlunatus soli TaxID=630515 RepID=A0A1H1ZKU6_9ACTN|nr:D-2-hydroxyacid dehydrogenase [Microlunatus soli]SDT33836.1 Phosphoglycerate dehydrogenase [Microlunatus soli]